MFKFTRTTYPDILKALQSIEITNKDLIVCCISNPFPLTKKSEGSNYTVYERLKSDEEKKHFNIAASFLFIVSATCTSEGRDIETLNRLSRAKLIGSYENIIPCVQTDIAELRKSNNELHYSCDILTKCKSAYPHIDYNVYENFLTHSQGQSTIIYETPKELLAPFIDSNQTDERYGKFSTGVIQFVKKMNIDNIPNQQVNDGNSVKINGIQLPNPTIHASPQCEIETKLYEESYLKPFFRELNKLTTDNPILQNLQKVPLEFVEQIESSRKVLSTLLQQ